MLFQEGAEVFIDAFDLIGVSQCVFLEMYMGLKHGFAAAAVVLMVGKGFYVFRLS